jgi:hypothetical protein
MLRKEVCKNCKNKAAGQFDGWSPHAEMCWEDIGIILCPSSIILSFAKSMRKKIRKVDSFSAAEKILLTEIFGRNNTSTWLKTATPIKEKPPVFCPNEEEH